MKTLLIVLDGLAGETKAMTALKVSSTPFLDNLAKLSKIGLMYPVPGVAPESDSAVLSILGYDPYKYHTGRGPLEAVGFGIKFETGMLALRCNFATSSDGKKLTDRRAGRTLTTKEAKELEKEINKKVKLTDATFKFWSTVQHRAVLIIKTKKRLYPKISNTDPAYERGEKGIAHALSNFKMEIRKCKPLDKNAKLSADLVNEFTEKVYKVLKNCEVNKKRKKKKLLPANIVLCRDAGNKIPKLFSISKKYKRKWAILADMPLEVGIGMLADMDVIKMHAPTFTKSDYTERLKKTMAALKKYDSLYVHIKGPDLFGHDGDFKGKVKSIEEIDKYFLGPLLNKLEKQNIMIVVTADHATPCSLAAHSADPVPILIFNPKYLSDNMDKFDEDYCARGTLKLEGIDLVPLMMRLS